MIQPTVLKLRVTSRKGGQEVVFSAHHLVCAGWVGKDQKVLQAHIDELAHLGVKGPSRVPTYMNFSTGILTTDDEIPVISDQTSGEVEYVLLFQGGDSWVTVGSDQTDRDIETKSIPASKQMCAKVLSRECWPLSEVKEHWDRLIMRCWVNKEKERTLYQENPLGGILSPEELLKKMPMEGISREKGLAVFSGTIPTKAGLIYGDSFELELEDPVLKRSIKHSYGVRVLPQYI